MNTYIVTRGWNEDYAILASFGTDRAGAEEFVARYNQGKEYEPWQARVEEFPVRQAGWYGSERKTSRTHLCNGEVTRTVTSTRVVFDDDYIPAPYSGVTPTEWDGRSQVYTFGPAVDGFDEAHAAAVAAALEKGSNGETL